MTKKYFLTEGEFSLQSKSDKFKTKKWYKAAVPGTIYDNLLRQKLIEDPFYADNELKLQWVAESDWSYRINFSYPGEFKTGDQVFLVFEGLDTIAEINLNGRVIGTSSNMFRKWQYDVTEYLSNENTLIIDFTSAYKYAREEESSFGKLPVALNSERVYIRKAQYSFGWDWGPSFADTGIWKPVYLIQPGNNFIRDFTFKTNFITSSEAHADAKIYFDKILSPLQKVTLNISDEISSQSFTFSHENQDTLQGEILIPKPMLWWPNGEGEQHLYSIKIILEEDGIILDELVKKVGLRKIELHLKDGLNNSFYFTVNGKRIFARGVNWIPADSFLTRVKKEKYQTLLNLAKKGNMNIIRVWGGGTYERDEFYEICDELGLLVWQDFMFACASYPEHEEFLENITAEINENVLRLQHHACLAIWCGNNENEWMWYQQQKKSYKLMPGYRIYSSLIPGILKKLDYGRPYWESSPFSDEEDPNSVFSGNRHQWDIWSNWKDYKNVIYDQSLFVTEFGFQGPANQSTFEKVIPPGQRKITSKIFEFHNKQVEGNERIFRFLSGHLPVKTNWKDFIYLAQLNQGFALQTCLGHWRFNYPKTNGSIIWQINDCWPVSSWALVDSDLKPKIAYYFVKNIFQPAALKFIEARDEISLHLMDDSEEFKGSVELSLINFEDKKIGTKKIRVNSHDLKTAVTKIKLNDSIRTGKTVIAATLLDKKKNLVHREVYVAPEWKYVKLPEAKIKAKLIRKNGHDFFHLKTNKPAFYVTVYSDQLNFENNSVTVLPGEEIYLPITINSQAKKITWQIFNLNMYL